MKKLKSVSWTVLAMAGLSASAAFAQTAPAEPVSDDTIIVTGTRTTGFKASDSPAPVQVLGSDTLARVGQADVIAALVQQLPSAQVQARGGDQAAFHPAIKLRGLNPNHTLVLIDGKRRHGTSSVNVGGNTFGGSAAPDLSLIPKSSIERIEVLQDGAAAQYGTDAIAGVVNFILKKSDHGGTIDLNGSKFFDGGGQSWSIVGNVGIKPFEDAYINFSAERRYQDYVSRSDVDPRVVDTGVAAASNTGVNGGRYNLARFPGITTLSVYPQNSQIFGDGQLKFFNAYYTAGWKFADNVELYGSGNYSKKKGRTWQFYRLPVVVFGKARLPNNNFVVAGTSAACRNNLTVALCPETSADIAFPNGFRPREETEETDYSIQAGLKGDLAGTTWDLTSTYGNNLSKIYVIGSANAALYYDTSTTTTKGFTPTDIYNGAFVFSQWTNTADLTHDFDVGFVEPITLAGGLEYRREVYQLRAGEVASYYTGTAGIALGGVQSFFGYAPANASRTLRHNLSQYLDISGKPIEAWSIDAAVRHEHYDDFGNTTIFKLTSRYDFSDVIAIRGTASTGFRAPTLGEGSYSGVNVSVASLSGVFPANSPGAAALGIAGLKPEKSTNFSLGFVFKPAPSLLITIDAYSIRIKDRIVRSSTFLGYSNNCRTNIPGAPCTAILSPAVVVAARNSGIPVDAVIANIDAGATGSVGINTFVNGVTSVTKGVDLLATYNSDFANYGRVAWSLAANYNTTKVTKVNAPPANIDQRQALLDVYALADLTKTTPKFRATAGAYWTLGDFSVNLRESYYGNAYSISSTPLNGSAQEKISAGAAFITDLELGYQLLEPVKLSIGANNLFNKYPRKIPQFIRDQQFNASSTAYITPYAGSSAYGTYGGIYYARISVKF